MKTALVFGGTRFFGVNLVEELIKMGVKVTVATRQQTPVPFGEKVERLQLDRFDLESVQNAVDGRSWDVVFDQICYNARDARITAQALEGKIRKYIFTSTMSVYPFKPNLVESDFDPYTHPIVEKNPNEVTYQEGKQQAEGVFFQEAAFPVVAVRIPIVLGEQDYTNRLTFHINRIQEGKSIGFPNIDAEMGYIHQQEAGKFLAWISQQEFTGPINACANGTWSMRKLIDEIEKQTSKQAILPDSFNEEVHSPYGIETSWYMSNHKATDLGYPFSTLDEWLPSLIEKLSK